MKIENSTRLRFALMGQHDAELLYELDQDAEVMRYINGGKMTTRQDVQDVFLPRMAKYTHPEKGWGLWKIHVCESNEFIGWILVRPMDYFSESPQWDNWELGWRFVRKSWGVGYATEAAKHIMQELSAKQAVVKFSAIALPDNEGSINIMKKLGMTYRKTDLHKDPLGDQVVVYYAVDVNK